MRYERLLLRDGRRNQPCQIPQDSSAAGESRSLLRPEVHQVPDLVQFDSKLFSIKEMPEPERKRLSREAAEAIHAKL
jgi:hypothetical protein